MDFQNNLKVSGDLLIRLDYADGTSKVHVDEKNVITILAKQQLLSGLYSSVVSDSITQLHVGIGGCYDPNTAGGDPKDTSQFFTQLYTPLMPDSEGIISVTHTVNSGVPSVTFIADLGVGAGIGKMISEAALYTTSGIMFNIKTFPNIPKTAEFAIHFEWTIKLA